MVRPLTIVSIVLLGCSLAAAPPAWEPPPGFTNTKGGAGGRVMRITTLAASGPGSLSEAVAAEGPRVIEFQVAGKIDLGGHWLTIQRPFLTVAGESAPSPGITIMNGGVSITTHDVIVRHLRVRATDPVHGKRPANAEEAIDGISTGTGAYDVIIDHCSISWATDENLSASGKRFLGKTPEEWKKNVSHRVTLSHNLVGEGKHVRSSKGTLIHDNTEDILVYGNLYVSNNDRHPLFKGGARAVAVNNFIYNPGMRIMQFGFVPSQWEGLEVQRTALTMVGNVARKGPSSAAEMVFFEVWPAYGPCDVYLHDNIFLDAAGKPLTAMTGFRDKALKLGPYVPQGGMRNVGKAPLWPSNLKARPASETAEWVLKTAGARPWERDATDRKLVDDVKNGTGKVLRFDP